MRIYVTENKTLPIFPSWTSRVRTPSPAPYFQSLTSITHTLQTLRLAVSTSFLVTCSRFRLLSTDWAWGGPSDVLIRLRPELCKLLILGGSNRDVQLDQLAFMILRRVHAGDLEGRVRPPGLQRFLRCMKRTAQLGTPTSIRSKETSSTGWSASHGAGGSVG